MDTLSSTVTEEVKNIYKNKIFIRFNVTEVAELCKIWNRMRNNGLRFTQNPEPKKKSMGYLPLRELKAGVHFKRLNGNGVTERKLLKTLFLNPMFL